MAHRCSRWFAWFILIAGLFLATGCGVPGDHLDRLESWEWRLQSFVEDGVTASPIPAPQDMGLTFLTGDRLSELQSQGWQHQTGGGAWGGVNGTGFVYESDGPGRISFLLTGSAGVGALDPALEEQETRFLHALEKVRGYAISDDVLTLSDEAGEPLLAFEAVGALQGINRGPA